MKSVTSLQDQIDNTWKTQLAPLAPSHTVQNKILTRKTDNKKEKNHKLRTAKFLKYTNTIKKQQEHI